MELKMIKQKTCPYCGSHIIAESCRSRHINGEGFETRTFDCELELVWVPNYSSMEEQGHCKNSLKYKKMIENRRDADKKIRELIDKLDIDTRYKEQVLAYLPLGYK